MALPWQIIPELPRSWQNLGVEIVHIHDARHGGLVTAPKYRFVFNVVMAPSVVVPPDPSQAKVVYTSTTNKAVAIPPFHHAMKTATDVLRAVSRNPMDWTCQKFPEDDAASTYQEWTFESTYPPPLTVRETLAALNLRPPVVGDPVTHYQNKVVVIIEDMYDETLIEFTVGQKSPEEEADTMLVCSSENNPVKGLTHHNVQAVLLYLLTGEFGYWDTSVVDGERVGYVMDRFDALPAAFQDLVIRVNPKPKSWASLGQMVASRRGVKIPIPDNTSFLFHIDVSGYAGSPVPIRAAIIVDDVLENDNEPRFDDPKFNQWGRVEEVFDAVNDAAEWTLVSANDGEPWIFQRSVDYSIMGGGAAAAPPTTRGIEGPL
jgi:hypothetical protein